MMRISENALRYAVFLLACAALAAPLVFSAYFYPSHAAPQTFLFRGIVDAMFFFWLVLAAKNAAFLPRFSWPAIAVGVFLAAQFLAAAFGIGFSRSFFSDFDRHWGLLTVAHIALFFFIVSSVVRDAGTWRILFAVSAGASALAAAYGLYQFFFTPDIGRIYGTIGNPAFFSSYLLLNALFAFFLCATAKNGNEKLIWCAGAMLGVVVAVLTGTRGGFLALIAAGAVLCVGYFFFGGMARKAKMALAAAGITAILSVVMLFVFRDAPFFSDNETLVRITHMSPVAATSQTRLLAWRAAWESAREHPLFGVGPEHFNTAFNRYFNPAFYAYERQETEFDRAHNVFLEQLATAGFVGLAAYAVLFAALVFSLVSAARKNALPRSAAIIFSAFAAAYAVQGFFSMDVLTSFMPFFLALAYGASAAQKQTAFARESFEFHSADVPVVAIVLAVTVAAAWFFAVAPARADRALSDLNAVKDNIIAFSEKEAVAAAAASYERAFAYDAFGESTVRALYVRTAFAAYDAFGKNEGSDFARILLPQGLAAARANAAQNPQSYFAHYDLARAYNLSYLFTKKEDLAVEQTLDRAQALAPGRLELPFARTQLNLLKLRFDDVIAQAEGALAVSDAFPDFYHLLFLAYNFKGDQERAFSVAEEGLAHGMQLADPREILWMADQYQRRGAADKAEEWRRKAQSVSSAL